MLIKEKTMKQELIKKITPIIENFVDETLKSFDSLEKIRKELINDQRRYEDLVDEKQKELDDIKKQKSLDRKEYDEKITRLENAKEALVLKAKSYEDLSGSLKSKNKEIEDKLAEANIELARAKGVREQADKTKEDAGKIKRGYELKLESLRIDTEKNDGKKKEQESEDKKLKARENDIFINEAKNSNRATELNDLELKVKTARKEVDRLIKRYNLEQKLKE